MKQTGNPLSGMLKGMVAAARTLKAEFLERPDPWLSKASGSLAKDLGRDVSPDEAADVLAQATVCAAPILAGAAQHFPRVEKWLVETGSEWERCVLKRALSPSFKTTYSVLSTQYPVLSTPPTPPCGAAQPGWEAGHLYDQFLHRYAPPARRQHGVYFTPPAIAGYLVRQVDAALQSDFGLPDGLASQSAIEVIDPACGTGVFLLAVINVVHAKLEKNFRESVPDLLARLAGIELLPVPALLAKLNLALKLAELGHDFRCEDAIRIRIGDALTPEIQSAIRNPQSAIPILLGNPPFGSLSTNSNPWIAGLVRGDDHARGYLRAGEQRLGERKTWLHDDYVKFIRLAQWHVEDAGLGIVGFVTNHGYLDNATFRLMRQELVRVFPRIDIVDLHGSRKKGESAPGGGLDENVFGLDQGVAIGIFRRPPSLARGVSEAAARVDYAELWGPREAKLAQLAVSRPLASQQLSPQPPHFRLIPDAATCHPEYAAGWPIDQVMPVHTTAPVTARDHFVVAFTPEELHQRIAEFRDLAISDETIRAKYFQRTRSRRYPRGDTRGWKLPLARRAVAADADWQSKIIRCAYRPFDWRFVFWHPAMIDWPRNEITRHLIAPISQGAARQRDPETEGRRELLHGDSSLALSVSPSLPLVLITRRQQLPTQPCTYFWISDCVALDGVIRSDNRGSESLFPLWLSLADGSRQANFAPAFLEYVASQLGRHPAAEEVIAYLYALFHSSVYRQRYAAQLRVDFPRVVIPCCAAAFAELALRGQQLIELHLLRAVDHGSPGPRSGESIPFVVGGYDVLKKWLQPKHRHSGDAQFQQIVGAVLATQRIAAEIDEAMRRHAILDRME